MGKEFVGFILGILFVCIAFWLGGFNFDERSPITFLLFIWSILGGYWGALLLKE